MLARLATLLLLPLGTLAAAVPEFSLLGSRALTPDGSCGTSHSGYTCPSDNPCCSQYGFCGATDAHCLTTANCQSRYSNSTSACHAPKPGVSISVDGTCGTTGVGKNGYRCPANATVTSCCSAAGYCGTTTDHCAAANGCQSAYGNCTGTAPKTSRDLFSVDLS